MKKGPASSSHLPERGRKNHSGSGVECNVITYNALLSACGRAAPRRRAARLRRDAREGVKPDKATFACVIAAHAGLGEHRRALDAFRGMAQARVEPDAAAATEALAACAAGDSQTRRRLSTATLRTSAKRTRAGGRVRDRTGPR